MEDRDLFDRDIMNSQSKDNEALQAMLWLQEFESVDVESPQDIRVSSWKEQSQCVERPVQTRYLPGELLNLIFERATPPSAIISLSLFMSRHSAWALNLQTKAALVAVSFDWYQAGIDFLYEDIAVYSIGQLAALEWTLRNRRDLGEKVVSIHFTCDVPKQYFSAFKHILKSLRSLCHKVTRIVVHDSFHHAFPFSSSHILPIFTGRSLTHLTIHDDDAYPRSDGTTGKIALFAEHLVSLVVYENLDLYYTGNERNPWYYRSGIRQFKEPLRFPRLKFLQLSSCHVPITIWILPALTTLALFQVDLNAGMEFVRVHGVTIDTLCFYLAFETHWQYAIFKKVLQGLPRLRHLIVPEIGNLSVPQIHHLELIQYTWNDIPEPIQNRANHFPNLKSYRVFDAALLHIPWIYTYLPPLMEGHFCFPKIDIRASASLLWGTIDVRVYPEDNNVWVSDSDDSDDKSIDLERELTSEEEESWDPVYATEMALNIWRNGGSDIGNETSR